MTEILVTYQGYGANIPLGTLILNGRQTTWTWSTAALQNQLDLSPFRLALTTTTQQDFPAYMHGLPGLVYDSLPDGWGLLLVDNYLAHQAFALTAQHRLATIGHNAFGALSFEPATTLPEEPPVPLQVLAAQCAEFQNGYAPELLPKLLAVGGSPQGARPKVAIRFDPKQKVISPDGEPWLFKFPHANEHTEVTAIEAAYADIAKAGGLTMPEHQWLEWPGGSAFGVKRFDRHGDVRIPIQSAAALLHADYRLPSSLSYQTLMKLTQTVTRNAADTVEFFSRIVFNILFHNQDSHSKNFAYVWQAQGGYHLAPAFDLTFNVGPNHEQHADLYGSGKPALKELMQLAAAFSISAQTASACIEKWLDLRSQLPVFLGKYPIRKTTIATIVQQCTAIAPLTEFKPGTTRAPGPI